MQGDKKVIDQLNSALVSELTAIVQYMTQSEMCQNWGYRRLGESTKVRAIEEMRHAEGLIERIIFLDSIPTVNVGLKPRLGGKVQEQIEINLSRQDLRRGAGRRLQGFIRPHDSGRRASRGLLGSTATRHQGNWHRQLPHSADCWREVVVYSLKREFGSQLHEAGSSSTDNLSEIRAAYVAIDRSRAIELRVIEDIERL